ncbi:MAG: hypothetical protein OEN00_06680 [Gemmatimonadota bacterium]|nr:hypothetical protein [Gemmatimonadota bacterium]
MASLVWGLEWRLALSKRRELALRVLVPLALVFVIASGALPAVAGVAVYAVLFVVFAHFGTALPALRDAESGITLRVVRGGVSPASYLMQRVAACSALALVELLPAFLVASVFLNASTSEILIALAALAVGIWIASLMGVVAAAVSGSRSEMVVMCGVSLVLLLHMSGVFQSASASGLAATLEGIAPFRAVHESFVTMVAGGAVGGAAASLAWALVLSAVVWLTAPRLTAALERSG